MVYFYTEANYEDRLFNQLSQDLYHQLSDSAKDDRAIQIRYALNFVHDIIQPRQKLFSETQIGGLKSAIIQPLTVDLMTGQGSCGSYALVMSRLLKEMNIPFRLVQMKVDGEFGGHILLEAEYAKEKWAVLDPSYNLYFTNNQGELASFDEVQNNWEKYSAQLPANYNWKYKYEDKRYTNWDKIPIVMPLTKTVLDWVLGKQKSDHVSLRAINLNQYDLYFNCTLFLQIALLIYIAYYSFSKKRIIQTEDLKTRVLSNPIDKKTMRKIIVKSVPSKPI